MKFFDRVAFSTPTTGQGTLSVGAVLSDAFFTLAEAGAADNDEVAFLIIDGNDVEIATGVLGDSLTTLTRATVLASKIGGTAGTTKLTLSGSAVVRLINPATFLNSLQLQDDDLDALAALAGTGIAVRTADSTWAQRAIQGTSNEVSVANGDGVSGDPTISLPSTLNLQGKTVQVDQLAFPATQNPSSDVNTLDDYEEGTWTPTLKFGGATTGISYDYQYGYYTKVGDMVFLSMEVDLANKGSASGAATISGLPFLPGNGRAAGGMAYIDNITPGSGKYVQYDIIGGVGELRFRVLEESTGSQSTLQNTAFNNSSSWRIFAVFKV